MSDITAIVLAAGGSSRMGQPKQLLPINEESCLRRAAKSALEATPSVIVVLGALANELRDEVNNLNVHVVVNDDWRSGMGSSVQSGLAAVPRVARAALFMLCDQPFLTSSHLQDLITAWQMGQRPMVASGYDGVAGVPAIFARACFADLQRISPSAGAKQLLAARPDEVTVVPFVDGSIDLDTPEDYSRWTSAAYGGCRHGRT